MKLLLAGFEPFGGSVVNPSQKVVERLAEEGVAGVTLCPCILAVDRERGPAGLIATFEQSQPDVVICLGEASGRSQISVERVFINWLDFAIADNGQQQVQDLPIVPNGPSAYFSTLPTRRLVEAINKAGVAARLSYTAGTFLCNQVSYILLHYLNQRGQTIPAGFIHLPALPEQAQNRLPSMSLEAAGRGIRATIKALLPSSIPLID